MEAEGEVEVTALVVDVRRGGLALMDFDFIGQFDEFAVAEDEGDGVLHGGRECGAILLRASDYGGQVLRAPG